MKRKLFAIIIISIFLLSGTIPILVSSIRTKITDESIFKDITNSKINSANDETEYWALIVGVGVYAKRPEQPDRTLPSNLSAKAMYDALLSSDHWQEDHIKVITGENATKFNIIKGLLWLDSMEDENDVSLVYISSHGWNLTFFGIPIDLPPFDEKDGCDEAIATYYSFVNPLASLRDDELNFFLNRLESHGICVVIDCCHAGGFNDLPHTYIIKNKNREGFLNYNFRRKSASSFIKGFSEEISKDGRVILMATREDEVGWAIPGIGHCFTNVLVRSLKKGFGDFDGDGLISAEEAFNYTRVRVDLDGDTPQHPTIYDGYDGELHLTVSKYDVTFSDDFESADVEWTTVDHSGGIGGDLWHLSESDSTSPTHCWYLGDKYTERYNNLMNNSLISPKIDLGKKPILTFNCKVSREYSDKLYFEVSTDNWTTYQTTKLYPRRFWESIEISPHSYPYWDLSGQTIQMRFRFVSDESIPFDLSSGNGYVMIDEIQIYSELIGA